MSEKCDSTDWLDIANKMFPYSYLKEAIFWALFKEYFELLCWLREPSFCVGMSAACMWVT